MLTCKIIAGSIFLMLNDQAAISLPPSGFTVMQEGDKTVITTGTFTGVSVQRPSQEVIAAIKNCEDLTND